jgi:hypothetical protein
VTGSAIRSWYRAALWCLVAALAAMALGVAGTRTGLWGAVVGTALVAAGVAMTAAAGVLAGLAIRRGGRKAPGHAIVVLAVVIAAVPVRACVASRDAAPISDVTTDLDNPPRYVAVGRLRGPGANSTTYAGAAVASAQREAYPDLRPLVVTAPPRQVISMVGDTARAEGWTIVAQDVGFGDLGRLEATDVSTWFGRVDDVVVRVLPHEAGSRVDVRSSARDDARDGGRNARRIRRFLAFLAERARTAVPGSPTP